MDDFYEDDEAIEKIQAIRTRPFDLVTARPRAGVSLTLGGKFVTTLQPTLAAGGSTAIMPPIPGPQCR